jgi:hypothetical protein
MERSAPPARASTQVWGSSPARKARAYAYTAAACPPNHAVAVIVQSSPIASFEAEAEGCELFGTYRPNTPAAVIRWYAVQHLVASRPRSRCVNADCACSLNMTECKMSTQTILAEKSCAVVRLSKRGAAGWIGAPVP